MRGQVSPSVRRRKQTKGKKSKHDIRAAVWVMIVQSIPTKIVQGAAAGDTCAAAETCCQATSRSGPCCLYRIQSVLYLLHNGNRAGWETMEARLYLHSLAHPLQGTIRTRTCSMYLN